MTARLSKWATSLPDRHVYGESYLAIWRGLLRFRKQAGSVVRLAEHNFLRHGRSISYGDSDDPDVPARPLRDRVRDQSVDEPQSAERSRTIAPAMGRAQGTARAARGGNSL